jgi:prepilin-type N-terminal cleavage/methylation domain-containing protein/prepilin-type processing-associated H-X9-DG protein
MPRRTSAAFTLVELLVVIAILVVLMSLLIPAVNGAIESGRRTRCMARQTRLALGMAGYDSRHNGLPGVRNKLDILSPDGNAGVILRKSPGGPLLTPGSLPIGTSTPSWFIMLLPEVERTDLFNAVVSGKLWIQVDANAGGANTGQKGLAQELTTCPSRPDWTSTARAHANMQYRANGAGIMSSPFNRDDGAIGDNANGIVVSLADIAAADGTANTLLITEAGQASAAISVGETWYPRTVWNASSNPPQFWTNWIVPSTSSDPCFFTTIGGNNGAQVAKADQGANLIFGFPPLGGSGSLTPNATTRAINNGNNWLPWSAHPGGCGVAFADGSCRFLRQDLRPHVYGHLVTSRSVWNGSNYSNNSATANAWLRLGSTNPYTIRAEDY